MKSWIIIICILGLVHSQEGYIDSSRVRNPSLAWKLGIVPGLGQIYNGKYFKAAGFIGAEYFTVNRFLILRTGTRTGLRNTYAWWIFGLYVWNIVDAYVDAHLSTFPVRRIQSNAEINDSTENNE